MTRNLVFIANLSAKNSANQLADFRSVVSCFEENKFHIHYFESRNIDELKSIIASCFVKKLTEYIVLGGDGSLHHLINALIDQGGDLNSFKIGVIPMGTGNDWLKNFNYNSKEAILGTIARGETRKIDLGRIQFQDSTSRYFINISGVGFNGAVIQNIARFKFLGKWAYYAALLYSFACYKSKRLKFAIDGNLYSENTFVLTIGIGKYAGGDMLLCPNAEIDDGLFDVNLIRGISKWKLFRNILRLKDGSYLNHLDCVSLRAKSIDILENDFLEVEADGEFLGKGAKRFEMLKESINIYS